MSSRILEQPGSPSTRGSHSLFFALWPSDAVRASIDAAARDLRRELAPTGRWLAPRRYHMTLHYLGNHAELAPELVAQALDAGDGVSTSAFDFALDLAGSFQNRTLPWWFGCSEVPPALHDVSATIAAGFRATDAKEIDGVAEFIPHVTVLRDAVAPLACRPISAIFWPVDEFVLVDSQLGAGANYTIVHRWPLARR